MIKKTLAATSVYNHLNIMHMDTVVYTYAALNMVFSGRFCKIGSERSGGYVVRAMLGEKYDHTYGRNRWISKRLKRGYTADTVVRAIQRLINELAEERTILRNRELVFNMAEERDIDLDVIDKISNAEGKTIVFDEMDMTDCEFWKTELIKFPLKEK